MIPRKAWMLAIGAVLSISMTAVSCAQKDGQLAAIDGLDRENNDPNKKKIVGGEARGENNFATLLNSYPEGRPDHAIWAGAWFPYEENGIAKGGRGGSPAGKYDAARGGMTNAQAWEVKNHGASVPRVQPWWGHCNGWTAAAALFEEPKTSKIVNGIEFGVGDIKALLTEAAMEVDADFFGNRVDWANDFGTVKEWDTVPNQLFLVLTNYMGKQKMGVLIDRYTTDQVWNQPLVAYRFKQPKKEDYIAPTPEAPNVHRIKMSVEIWWADDGVPADIITPPFDWSTNAYAYGHRALNMELWLDGPVEFDAAGKVKKSGNLIVAREGEYIVGGKWTDSQWVHSDLQPDYMWVAHDVIRPGGVDENEAYGNPHIDIDWIKKHVLTGTDDPTVRPSSIPPAPNPSNSPSPRPTSTSTSNPNPNPTFTTIPGPTFTPAPGPTFTPAPGPTSTGGPGPGPGPTGTGTPR